LPRPLRASLASGSVLRVVSGELISARAASTIVRMAPGMVGGHAVLEGGQHDEPLLLLLVPPQRAAADSALDHVPQRVLASVTPTRSGASLRSASALQAAIVTGTLDDFTESLKSWKPQSSKRTA
jgi:hypothetical protein